MGSFESLFEMAGEGFLGGISSPKTRVIEIKLLRMSKYTSIFLSILHDFIQLMVHPVNGDWLIFRKQELFKKTEKCKKEKKMSHHSPSCHITKFDKNICLFAKLKICAFSNFENSSPQGSAPHFSLFTRPSY